MTSGSFLLNGNIEELSTEFPDVILNAFCYLFISSQFRQNGPFLLRCCSQNGLIFFQIDHSLTADSIILQCLCVLLTLTEDLNDTPVC